MTTPNDEGTRLHRVAAAALGLVSLVYAVLFLALLPPRLAAPTAISAIEPQPVAGALRVARGEILYRDFFAERPVLPLTYGALPYWITGKSARLIGSTEPRQVMRVGRAITLFGTLAVTLLLAFLAFQRGVSVRWAGLACLPMFWFPYLAEWWVKFTPDAPALALSLAGWALLGPPDREQSGRFPARLVGAVLLWTLAFHFKPTVLAGPMGFGIERLVAARAPSGDPRERGAACCLWSLRPSRC
ncbi:MAG: hypothetical protein KF858_08645 [Candidatus Sumerlaeia bacterium]|nr:hypothetical protein [Candidatus Sumerlaeia bacterium]